MTARPLTREEETALVEQARQAPPEQADALRWRLAWQWDAAARQAARRYLPRAGGCPLDDLEQAARLGLHKAAERFDPARGCRFSTYARWWVRAEMQALAVRHHVHRGLETHSPLASRDEDGEPLPLLERLGQPAATEEDLHRAELLALLVVALEEADLTPRERAAIDARHLREPPLSRVQLARLLHLSYDRARQVEMDALEKLRTTLSAWGASLH